MAESLSRASILKWLDSNGMHIPRIEDVGKGVVLCQLLTRLDPTFPKFRTDVSNEPGYLYNLVLVKNYMEKRSIKLYLPIERMCKLKMQDNLEVIQWFHKYWFSALKDKTDGLQAENDLQTTNGVESSNTKIQK